MTIFSFWFLLLISCQREVLKMANDNSTNNCSWTTTSNYNSLLSYNVWLVNGHPSSASNKPIDFDHQFSFEQQVMWIFLSFYFDINKIISFYRILCFTYCSICATLFFLFFNFTQYHRKKFAI